MKMLSKILSTIVTAAALVTQAGPAWGGNVELASQTVQVADLDLRNAPDLRTLYERIQRAARLVCRHEHSAFWDVKRVMRKRQCYERTLDAAVGRARIPALAALHRGATGTRRVSLIL